jgi:hypothetical protein
LAMCDSKLRGFICVFICVFIYFCGSWCHLILCYSSLGHLLAAMPGAGGAPLSNADLNFSGNALEAERCNRTSWANLTSELRDVVMCLEFSSSLHVAPVCHSFLGSIIYIPFDTIWLFNIAMENPPIFKFGKPLFLWAIEKPWLC